MKEKKKQDPGDCWWKQFLVLEDIAFSSGGNGKCLTWRCCLIRISIFVGFPSSQPAAFHYRKVRLSSQRKWGTTVQAEGLSPSAPATTAATPATTAIPSTTATTVSFHDQFSIAYSYDGGGWLHIIFFKITVPIYGGSPSAGHFVMENPKIKLVWRYPWIAKFQKTSI